MFEATSTDCTESSDDGAQKKFKCDYAGCNASFSKSRKFIIHTRRHTGERPFECTEKGCTKTYTNSSHLTRHIKTYHQKDAQKPILCSVEGCGLMLSNKYALKKHSLRKHNEFRDYPFSCTECKKGFHKKKHLLHHSVVHSATVPFKCDECTQGFATLWDLNRHKRSHKTYSCTYCSTVFNNWTSLIVHNKQCQVKKNQRVFCDTCLKSFSSKTNLKIHLLTHKEDDKKDVYKCEFPDCSRYYFQLKNLTQHVKSVHNKTEKVLEKIACPKGCGVTFKTQRTLKNHIDLKHSGKVKEIKPKKKRKDKGVPKSSMTEILTGIKPQRDTIVFNEDLAKNTQDSLRQESFLVEDPLLVESEKVLQILEKITGIPVDCSS